MGAIRKKKKKNKDSIKTCQSRIKTLDDVSFRLNEEKVSDMQFVTWTSQFLQFCVIESENIRE